MTVLFKGVVRDGKVEMNQPLNWPDGTEVVVTQEVDNSDNGPVSPDETARLLAAMQQLEPLDIPADVAADLDEWERKIEQYGIDRDNAEGLVQ